MNALKKEEYSPTEEKIRVAAKKVFLQKGYAGTRTRDIADEAGINLALLNYYFRSKQKLFEVVMLEKIQKLLGNLVPIMNDPETTLEEKIELIVAGYIDVLVENPDLPIFVLNELHKGNVESFPIMKIVEQFKYSSFFIQLSGKRSDLNPVQFLVTLLGMTIFPFVAKPVMVLTDLVDENSFTKVMYERKILVTRWMKLILNEKT